MAKKTVSEIKQGELTQLSTGELVEIAVVDEEASHDKVTALVILQQRGTREVLDAALSLCASPSPSRRKVGAQILGELGSPRSFRDECCDALLGLLRSEKDEDVFTTVVFMFAYVGNARCEPDLIALRNHPNPRIRYGVAFSLAGAQSPEAIETQLQLMEDTEPMARDWATTAIGQNVNLNGQIHKDALWRRVNDSDMYVRAEALHGLARRGDMKIVPFLIKELKAQNISTDVFEYAANCLLGLDEGATGNAEVLLTALQAKLE